MLCACLYQHRRRNKTMRLLAIDCATDACSAALWAGDAPGPRRFALMRHGHAEALMPMIQAVMNEAGLGFSQLDAIAATLDGHGGAGNPDDGLVIGSPVGVRESGLTLTMGRRSADKSIIGSSLTRPLSDLEAAEVRSLTFAFPFCGNRDDVAVTPVDSDFTPLVGVDAILASVGMLGAADGGGVGWLYKFTNPLPQPMSVLIYYFGNRLELLSCRTSSLVITCAPGTLPTAVATIEVGSVKDPTTLNPAVAALPTLTAPDQLNVRAPITESVAHTWNVARGYSSNVLTIAQNIVDIPDSNAVGGFVKEVDGRTTSLQSTVFVDDADTGETFELGQLFADDSGD